MFDHGEARLPSEGGTRYEDIAGGLIGTPAPGRRHQAIVTGLVARLDAFARGSDHGALLAGPIKV